MTSVEFVEKALIGSLLNDSTRRDELPWLRAEDFTIPLCLAIWRHLESGNPPHCQPLTDLVDLSEALGRDCELHPAAPISRGAGHAAVAGTREAGGCRVRPDPRGGHNPP
jgi:hypothetical protein